MYCTLKLLLVVLVEEVAVVVVITAFPQVVLLICITQVTPTLIIWKWHLWIIFIFMCHVTGNLFILGLLSIQSHSPLSMHIISGLECGSTAISPLFWIKSAGTWAFQSCGDPAEGNWLSQRPGTCFRIPWVIILFCSWKASAGYKSSLNRVSELRICQPDAHVRPRAAREERLWALTIAFVQEWMSVFPFCKKLYVLRLRLCSDKAALLFSKGITWLQQGAACSATSRGSCAIGNSQAMSSEPFPVYVQEMKSVCADLQP